MWTREGNDVMVISTRSTQTSVVRCCGGAIGVNGRESPRHAGAEGRVEERQRAPDLALDLR